MLGEELVMHWGQVYKLPVVSLRFFNVYGPRSRTSGTYGAVFGVFLAQKLAGEPLTVVGDGRQTRDFTYVTDVAAAVLAVANAKKYACFKSRAKICNAKEAFSRRSPLLSDSVVARLLETNTVNSPDVKKRDKKITIIHSTIE